MTTHCGSGGNMTDPTMPELPVGTRVFCYDLVEEWSRYEGTIVGPLKLDQRWEVQADCAHSNPCIVTYDVRIDRMSKSYSHPGTLIDVPNPHISQWAPCHLTSMLPDTPAPPTH